MSDFDNATAFFHACEGLEGWAGCSRYVADGATFEAQSEPIADITTVEGYCDWLAGVGGGPLAGCSYDLHASAWDETTRTALFYGTFKATHSQDGGPVPPTNRATNSHYVYALRLDQAGRIDHMTKIWNAPWAMSELGWA